MPIKIKTLKELVRLTNGKYNQVLTEIDPTIDASFARATSESSAAAGLALQEGIEDSTRQSFWQSADDEFLELIGEYDRTFRYGAQLASGFCSVGGVLSTLVPAGTSLTSRGFTYLTIQDSAVQTYTGNISLTFSSGIVTAVTSATHSLSSNLSVTISGATQTDYNGTFVITVIDENTFTYELSAGSLTSDNGSYSSDYVLLNIESSESGVDVNLDAGASLSISVTDIDDTAYVGVDGISGGLNQEEIEDYRTRVGEAHNLTPGISTPPTIIFSAKRVAGNTRVYVIRPEVDSSGNIITGGTYGQAGYLPELGETVIYILRDNDSSIIPSQALLDETKQQILNDGLWPTFLPDANLFVLAPIEMQQDFDFSAISPNTVTMQNAIRDQLVSFFEDYYDVGEDILLDDIKAFLRQIQDPSTGAILESYTLTNPSTDISVDSGEIYTRGTVTFP